ncbi:MAG TPA: choice-of-anchor D domain-containing protein, partial [Rhizobium sp.]|nr:choice-of-anchor D domain-containing protein [Rhizobium sp.]
MLAALGAVGATDPAVAQPGTPGQPQAPVAVYSDSFQNRPGPTPIVKLNAYTSTSGQTYSADPDWLTNCNGWIASANQPTDGATQATECGNQNAWNRTQQLSWALGLHTGQSQAAAQGNYAVSAFTSSATLTGGQVEFRTATNIPFPTNNRFLSFSVDVAAVNCSVAAPLLQFSLVDDGGIATPAGSQINACTSGTTQNVPALGVAAAGAVSTGTYTSNGAVLISGASFGVRMVNNTGTGVGNDHAFDNINVLDTTPQLDKAFGPTNVAVGGVSTLTFTITNTSELGSKTGWSFTDALPAGLKVASDEISTTCPSGIVTAPVGGSTIDVSGNLTAGMASCTATVPVTSSSAGTYANDASNITSAVGVNPPGSTSVTFGTQPNFVCDSTMYFGIGAPTRLHRADTSTNPFTFPGIGGVYSPGYNAMGYDIASNYIYATRWDTTTSRYRLLRIGSNGSVSDQGPIVGGGINNGSGGIASGVIGADGYYYVKENSATNVMWRVDLTTRAATSIPLNRTIANSDLAWHNGLIYTHDQVSDIVYSINPNSGAVTPIGPSGLSATAGFGSLISASNGIFGRYNNGGFYQFDLATGVATLISDAPAGVGDGAKCPVTAVSLPADTQITKTDGSETYAPGTNVTYTMVVSNSGPFGVQNASVNDPLPAGITEASWTCGSATNGGVCGTASGTGAINDVKVSLPAGASVTFQLTLTVPADFAGDVVNTATVANPSAVPDPDTSNNSATDTDVAAAPALTVEKTGTLNDLDGDGLIDVGETISYSFLVRNTGNVTLTNVTVDDPLLTNAGVSVTPGPQTLAPSGSVTFTATYTPTQADIDAGQVENTATGTGTPPSGPPIESPPDTVTVPPDQTPGMTIEKSGTLNDADGDGLIDLGETISYSFLVRNTGSVTLTNVTVDDPMLTNAGVSVTPGPQTLGPGGSVTFTASYTPTQADIDNGQVENTATGTGTPPSGPPIESPPDTVLVPPDVASGMTIEKSGTLNDGDGDGFIDLGETISYSFLVRNTGNVTLTNVTVDDPMLTNAGVSVTPGPQTLAPGGSVTFTATYTPTQADIDAGRVENTATGTGTPPSGPPIESPPDTVTVPPEQAPGMTIEKSGTLNDADGDGFIDLGETISYSFLVRNTGNVTLTNVTVDDPMLTNAGVSVSPGPQTLAPAGTVTFTATYTPTQADIDAGRVENSATGTGTPPSGPPVESPPDTVTVPPDQTPGMTIEKTGSLNDADGDGLIDLGETISYSF